MWPDDEKAAENTCCIVKGFEEVWTHFCPSKPCLPLSTDTGGMRIGETAKTAPVFFTLTSLFPNGDSPESGDPSVG